MFTIYMNERDQTNCVSTHMCMPFDSACRENIHVHYITFDGLRMNVKFVAFFFGQNTEISLNQVKILARMSHP